MQSMVRVDPGCLEKKREGEGWIIKGHKETLEVMEMFVILIGMRVLSAYVCQN